MDWRTPIREALTTRTRAPDEAIVEELADYAAAVYDTARAGGQSAEDANDAVQELIEVWRRDATRFRRPSRPATPVPPPAQAPVLAGLWLDTRYGLRCVCRDPWSSGLTLVTLALGIAATVTLFTVANRVLFSPLSWPDVERLVRLEETRGGRPGRIPWTISNALYFALSEQSTTIEALGGYSAAASTATLTGAGDASRVPVSAVTATLLGGVLRVRPALGRLFRDDDPGGFGPVGVALLSDGLWHERFGGDVSVLGRTVQLDGRPHTIVGVMPEDFTFPDRQTRVWTHFGRLPPVQGRDGVTRVVILGALARVGPDVTPAQVAAEATAQASHLPDLGAGALALFGTTGPVAVAAQSPLLVETDAVRPAILVLLAATILLLATATGSVVSLQLARAARRQREVAIRAAMGAGVARLARQWVVESSLVTAAAAVIGLALAMGLIYGLPAWWPADVPRLDEVALDRRGVGLSIGLSLIVTLACSLMPAWRGRRLNLMSALAEDGSAPLGGSLRTPTARARAVITAGQVALACVLLVGGVLLARTFLTLVQRDRGYDPAHLLAAQLPFPRGYPSAQALRVLDGLRSSVSARPAVEAAAFGSVGSFYGRTIASPRTGGAEIEIEARLRYVSPAYLTTLGARLRMGRFLREADTAGTDPVIVVNQAFARQFLGAEPINQWLPLNLHDHRDWQVIGVVDDIEGGGMNVVAPPAGIAPAPAQPEIFVPVRQVPTASIDEGWLVIRSDEDPGALATALRTALQEENPTLAFESVMTMEERIQSRLAWPRLYAWLVGAFALFAVMIAGVGLFGVLSYTTTLRTREIGIRTALGAVPRDIIGLVLRQAFAMTIGGILTGFAFALGFVQSLSTLVYGVSTYDVVTFLLVALVVLAVALLACVVPARRAAGLDAWSALRSQ